MSGRLLVATDGRVSASGAFHVAATLADRDGMEVDVLTVVEPLAADAGILVDFPHRNEIERARAEEMLDRVVERLDDALGPAAGWQIELEVGHPAATIARVARETDATIIVLDVDHHDAAGNRIAQEVIQLASVPVLATRECQEGCLKNAIVGLDFSESSRDAARLALATVGRDGHVRLAHVRPRLDFPAALLWNWNDSYRREVEARFTALEAELVVPEGTRVERVSLDGEPAAELMDLARRVGSDLIVIGGSGYTFRDRIMIGSVAQRLVADAGCSVLTTPPVSSKRVGIPTISLKSANRSPLSQVL